MAQFVTIPAMVRSVNKKYADKNLFLYKKNGKYVGLKHKDADAMIDSIAIGFLEKGVKRGDRVALISENRIEWALSLWALLSIGAVVVPIFPSSTAKQEEYIFNDCQVSYVLVSNNFQLNKVLECKGAVESLRFVIVFNSDIKSESFSVTPLKTIIEAGEKKKKRKNIMTNYHKIEAKGKEDDTALLIYTSGTTGDPKGVMLTHKNLLSNMESGIDRVKITESDLFLTYLPWCHAYEMIAGLHCATYVGATSALADSIETVGINLKEVRPTILTTVPKLLEMIMKRTKMAMKKEKESKQKIFEWAMEVGREYSDSILHGKAGLKLKTKYSIADKMVFSKIREKTGGRLKTIISGGAPMNVEVAEFFFAAGYEVLEGYGLTEASPMLTITDVKTYEIGTIGRALRDIEIKLAEDGEMIVRGPNIMKGYWNDPDATAMAIDNEGWLYTGDIATITEKGNFKITDRKKNIIVNAGGKNIAPQPIENVLVESSYIEQVILVGDKREYITALITPDFTHIKQLADTIGIQYENPEDLTNNPKIVQVIKNDIDRLQQGFAKYERVRKFRLLSAPFSIEHGELTPKLSIRRQVIERNYSFLIDEMYNVG